MTRQRWCSDQGFRGRSQFGRGARREGFATLRDIISRFRVSWGKQYLERYLRARWDTELRDSSREYHLLQNSKGRPPTASQFAKAAVSPVNHWFGGDLSSLYRAIGIKSPITPNHRERIPIDRVALARAVAEALDGKLVGSAHFGEVAPWYLQLEEVLGRPPELKEFGVSKLGWLGQEKTQDPEVIWRIYRAAVESTKMTFLASGQ